MPEISADDRHPQAILEQTAAQLRQAVAELATQLRPFPPFLGMNSLQAIELEPPPGAAPNWGCIVLLPDGEICELELEVIPGPAAPVNLDQVDQYRPLNLPATDYIHFAAAALRAMSQELDLRR